MISKVALTSSLNAVFQQCKVHLRDITQMAKRDFFEYSGHPPATGFWVPHGFFTLLQMLQLIFGINLFFL